MKRGYVASGCSATGLKACTDPLLLPGLHYYSYKPTSDFSRPQLDPSLFSPMVWCSGTLNDPIPVYVVRPYILFGFNEVDSSSQCGITPQVAAERYAILMNNNPYPNQLTSPSCASGDLTWFLDFFAECARLYPTEPMCRVTIMNVHRYVCTVQSLMSHLNKIHDAFNLPIVLTEFACNLPTTNSSVTSQMKYMQQAVNILESTDFVLKYYWFTAHIQANNALIKVINGVEELSELGALYLSLPHNSPSPSSSPSSSVSQSGTSSSTSSQSSSPTSSWSRSSTPTSSSTLSNTGTTSFSSSSTPSFSATPSFSESSSITPSNSFSPSRSPTKSRSNTRSSTTTPSTTKSPRPSRTSTKSKSATRTSTPTPSQSRTPSKSQTPSRSLTRVTVGVSSDDIEPTTTPRRKRKQNKTF